MRLTINKSVSKSVGIWTFLLLFILKGVFPEPAYAFLSSLDACAVQPECAAAIGLELSPTIAAPTAEAAGTTAISTTTATGATTSSVEAVAGTTVVGDMRLPGVAAFYIWNKAQNQKAQEKAKDKYCSANLSDPLCVYPGSYTVSVLAYTQHFTNPSTYSTPNCSVPGGDMSTGWEGLDLYVVADGGQKVRVISTVNWNPWTSATITSIVECRPPSSVLWKDWPQGKRDEAVRLLNPSDWQSLITSMPVGGILNPGDKIHAPTIVIPGQETDDPNTPADERLLKKESGFFTFPGIPDFDKDGIPDSIDLDNDNDGIVNTNDPEPYNPNIPFASSLPDESAKVTPEVLQDIRDIVSNHKNEFCVECAAEIEAYLREKGISGERLILDTVKENKKFDSFIYDETHPPTAAPDYIISTNGHHEGIAIKFNGEEKVFDNHHPDGVPTREQWMKNLTYYTKMYGGPDFRESGYCFLNVR